MQIKLKKIKCRCSKCEKTFYEWEDFSLERCPCCGADLFGRESADEVHSQLVEVKLDPLTGRVGIASFAPSTDSKVGTPCPKCGRKLEISSELTYFCRHCHDECGMWGDGTIVLDEEPSLKEMLCNVASMDGNIVFDEELKTNQAASFTVRCNVCGAADTIAEGKRKREERKIDFGTDHFYENYITCSECGNALQSYRHWEYEGEEDEEGYEVEKWM